MHLPSSQNMQVEMSHGLAAVFAGVNHGAKAFAQAGFPGNFGGDGHQMSGERSVVFAQVSQGSNMFARDN